LKTPCDLLKILADFRDLMKLSFPMKKSARSKGDFDITPLLRADFFIGYINVEKDFFYFGELSLLLAYLADAM
jgi:hypothetical protein